MKPSPSYKLLMAISIGVALGIGAAAWMVTL